MTTLSHRAPVAKAAYGRVGAGVLALGLVALSTVGCTKPPPPDKSSKPADVVVTTPITDEVTDYQDFTGRLDALKTVDIRPRVSGYVVEIPFKEGDLVREGDLLFQIDPRSYEADYRQAEANYKQAEADRRLQERNASRARRLRGTGAQAEEDYDIVIATAEKSTATALAMDAARNRAKLYLDWTRVTAPVSGRISRRNVDPGNLVNADQTLLTTIVTEDLMYAYFDMDERSYLNLVGAAAYRPGQGNAPVGLQFPVLMRLANEDEYTHPGTVNFVDNRLNANTGTIRMRGVFKNDRGTLKPGLFVRIRLPIGTPYQALLIPDEAILSDQGRKYVYVVNDQNLVEYRTVTLGQAIHELRVIKEGLKGGEHVIVTGMQRVRPKAEVAAQMQPPPKPPHVSLSKVLHFDRPSHAATTKPAATPAPGKDRPNG